MAAGEKVIITSAVSDEEAKERFGTFEQPKPYLRYTDQPKGLSGPFGLGRRSAIAV